MFLDASVGEEAFYVAARYRESENVCPVGFLDCRIWARFSPEIAALWGDSWIRCVYANVADSHKHRISLICPGPEISPLGPRCPSLS
jgi:hypothetical protein